MKQTTSYRFLSIQNKIRGDLKIIIDTDRNPEYVSNNASGTNTSIAFYPIVTLTIVKPPRIDENGQRVQVPWTINDSLSMNKINLAIFKNEFKEIMNGMKTPELYTYHGKRLELNESIAEEVRRVFMINPTMTVELSPVVIMQDDDRLEGIKIKFNNEQSTVTLTLNEVTGFYEVINKLEIDSVAMLLYLNYASRPDKPKQFDALNPPNVDIVPKSNADFL